jgi:hypothetical protein
MTSDPQRPRTTESLAGRGADRSLHDLVRSAFDAAHQSGIETWDQMTVAVLKNRLLDLTHRVFDEREYGARSMTDLVRRRLADTVALDEEARPPVVRLLRPEAGPVPVAGDASRVRRDLWNAVMDYRSQVRYVWDGTRAWREDEAEHGGAQRHQVLPTLTEAEMDGWRGDFIAAESSFLDGDERARTKLEHWRRHRLGTNAIPALLKQRWNTYLKDAVVVRLRGWFAAASIHEPDDLLVQPRQRRELARAAESVDPKALRELVMRCVQEMTVDELRGLPLPAGAVLRASS